METLGKDLITFPFMLKLVRVVKKQLMTQPTY